MSIYFFFFFLPAFNVLTYAIIIFSINRFTRQSYCIQRAAISCTVNAQYPRELLPKSENCTRCKRFSSTAGRHIMSRIGIGQRLHTARPCHIIVHTARARAITRDPGRRLLIKRLPTAHIIGVHAHGHVTINYI